MDLFGDQYPQYQAPAWQSFNPATFGGGMGTNYQNAVSQQLSGVLSPAQLAMLKQSSGTNMAQANATSFGMPSGAAASLANNTANNSSIQQYLLGQQNVQQGESAAMPYMGMGASQNTAQNQFNLGNAANTETSSANAYNASLGGGIVGGLTSAIAPWVLNYLFPGGNKSSLTMGAGNSAGSASQVV